MSYILNSIYKNKIESFFNITKRKSSIKYEIIGGVTTFLTMSYIICVNPAMLSMTGMDKGALITTTCVSAAFGTILMGLLGNVPIALAPGMGLNAFFTFTLVIGQGISWQDALGVVFVSGLFFMILSLSGMRRRIANAIPLPLILSATTGIGLFIALIGFKSMDLIVSDPVTLVSLGEFTVPVLLSLLGLLIMFVLEVKSIKGGILIGILATTFLGIPFGLVELPASFFSFPPSIAPIAFKLNILGALKWSLGGAIFSFMFVDMFDSLAFLLACSKQMGLEEDKTGEVSGLGKMLYADVASTLLGAVLGTSTVTSFGESAAGISAGARTGLASIVTGFLFLLALFITPMISIIPTFASAPALVMVGVFMFKSITLIDLSDIKIAITSFVTMFLMPLTYSISIGISFGFITYIILYVLSGEFKKISLPMWFIGLLSLINLIVS